MNVLSKKEEDKLLKGLEASEKIEKEASLSWDGTNLLVRLPKELSEFLDLNEKNRFKKQIKFIVEEKEGEVKKTFEVVERTKPKRKLNKNVKSKNRPSR